jgi:hypothetical protein
MAAGPPMVDLASVGLATAPGAARSHPADGTYDMVPRRICRTGKALNPVREDVTA